MAGIRALFLAALALLSSACATASSNTLAGAVVGTTVGLGIAATSRALGGCVAICTNGTSCNPKTGWCERAAPPAVDHRGERCQQTFAEVKCEPAAVAGVSSVAPAAVAPQLPLLPAKAPESSGPPSIVRKAEEQPPHP